MKLEEKTTKVFISWSQIGFEYLRKHYARMFKCIV